ncbi:MAG TPA: glycosyltransferase family 39 protein [Candidatus Paceibacterota bacterium]
MVWGAFLRFSYLGRESLWIDEGYTINAAKAILDHGYPLLDSGAIYPYGALHSYLTAGFLELFGFDAFSPWSARLPSAITGIALVAIIAFVAHRMAFLGRTGTLLAAFLTAFSLGALSWSRQARGYMDMALFSVLAFYGLYRWRETGKKRYVIGAIASFAAALLSHGPAIALLPTFITCIVLGFCGMRKPLWHLLISLAIPILSLISGISFGFHHSYISFFIQYWPFSCVFWLAVGSCILLLFDQKKRHDLLYLWLPFVSGMFALIFFSMREEPRYLFPLFPFAILLSIYGVARIGRLLNMPNRFVPAFAAMTLVACAWPGLVFVPRNFYITYPGVPQADFASAFQYIKDHFAQGDIVVSAFPHLHELYLGTKGYWLPTNLSPYPDGIERATVGGKDYYVGAPMATGTDALLALALRRHGFALFSGLGSPQFSDVYFDLLALPGAYKIHDTGENSYPIRIWIVRF